MGKSIGFIGGGRITRIILQALNNQNQQPDRVLVYDKNPEVGSALRSSFPEIKIAELNETATQEIVFIALHPPVIMETLSQIKEVITKDSIFISLAPKITIENIFAATGNKNIVRLIPNATSVINEGYNPVCFNNDVNDKQEILDLLSILGTTFETEESKLEAYAISSAMLPTYFWFQWVELVQIAKQMGLSEEESKDTIEQTLRAAVDVMFKSELTMNQVLDLIPVKPIGEHEQQIREIYQTRLQGLFDKIRPVIQPAI